MPFTAIPEQAPPQQRPDSQPQAPINPLEWWNGDPDPMGDIDKSDPQIKKWEGDYFNTFAQGYHQQDFQSLKQYEAWMRKMPTAFKEIDGFMRKIGLQYMPRRIKEEYEQATQLKKMEDQFKRTMDMQGEMASKIQNAIEAGDLPEGVYFDPKTMGLNFKAPKRIDPSKERNQIITQLGKLRQYKENADIDGSEDESAIYAQEITSLVNQLRGATQGTQLSEEDSQALQWAQANPDDPRAVAIMQMLQSQ